MKRSKQRRLRQGRRLPGSNGIVNLPVSTPVARNAPPPSNAVAGNAVAANALPANAPQTAVKPAANLQKQPAVKKDYNGRVIMMNAIVRSSPSIYAPEIHIVSFNEPVRSEDRQAPTVLGFELRPSEA